MENGCCATKPSRPAGSAKLKEGLVLYRPLLVIVALSVLSALVLFRAHGVPLMSGLMGFMLLFLSSLKLFDVKGFAAAFARYDLLAARLKPYGLAYPFIELALGLLYLSGLIPVVTNIVLIAVLAVGSLGVIGIMREGSSVRCACVGTGFSLPVGKVTLLEYAVMAAMAAVMLAHQV